MTENNLNEDALEGNGGEFEREPVPASKLKSWRSFLGMYAGEHAVGTEFMIGSLFLVSGVSTFSMGISFAIFYICTV